MRVILNQFDEFRLNPNKWQRIKFDLISVHLKRFFMTESDEKDVKTGDNRWDISFDEITTVYPNIKELHFINNYKFDNIALQRLIRHIQNGNLFRKQKGFKEYENTIEKIAFLYYDYVDSEADANGKPINHEMFYDPDHLNKESIKILKKEGWILKHHNNGKTGYKIRILKKN